MAGTLYVVGTPIGNLSDFSPRAIDTLNACDFIAAEDTRVTRKLLNHFEIKKPMISYYEHNRRERGETILARLLEGESCALVTDAGMPAISDPGQDLVDLCLTHGVQVASVPGPTAFATAVALSGLPSGRITFEGFLSVNKPGRKAHLESVKTEMRTMVFYEAPHKLAATLKDMYACFGDRRIAVIKEITKLHENIDRTTLAQAAQKYAEAPVKGEYVLVIEGAPAEEKTVCTLEDALKAAEVHIAAGLSNNEAAKQAAKQTGVKKSEIYKVLAERG